MSLSYPTVTAVQKYVTVKLLLKKREDDTDVDKDIYITVEAMRRNKTIQTYSQRIYFKCEEQSCEPIELLHENILLGREQKIVVTFHEDSTVLYHRLEAYTAKPLEAYFELIFIAFAFLVLTSTGIFWSFFLFLKRSLKSITLEYGAFVILCLLFNSSTDLFGYVVETWVFAATKLVFYCLFFGLITFCIYRTCSYTNDGEIRFIAFVKYQWVLIGSYCIFTLLFVVHGLLFMFVYYVNQ